MANEVIHNNLPQANLTVVPAEVRDVIGRDVRRADQRDVTASGTVFVFATDFGIMSETEDILHSHVRTAVPMWWKITGFSQSQVFRLRFNNGGLIAQNIPAPIAEASRMNDKLLKISTSLAMVFRRTPTHQWMVSTPTIGIPGALLFVGRKPSNYRGLAGSTLFTTIGASGIRAGAAPWAPQPVYCVWRFTPPRGASTNSSNPQNCAPLGMALTCGSNIFIASDVSAYAKAVDSTYTVAMIVGEVDCTNIGFWFPDAETGTDAASSKYWGIDVEVYGVGEVGHPPLGGGSSAPATGASATFAGGDGGLKVLSTATALVIS